MTRLTVGFGPGFPRVWALPIGALTLLLALAAFGVLSRSIVADLLAWWPVWAGLGAGAYLARDKTLGVVRLAGAIPLLALAFVALFAWGHLAGWAIMPSAAQRLIGPEADDTSRAALSAVVDGIIEVRGSAGLLYRVDPIRRGGRIGVPTAGERVAGPTVSVTFEPPEDPGIYAFAGWDIALSDRPSWTLHLDGAVDARLEELTIDSLELGGAGMVKLGRALSETPVRVSGSYRIVIPAGSAARVDGVASVPATWLPDATGATSPGGPGGWSITVVSGATLTIVER